MPLMKITSRGLSSIAVLTGLLWSCIVVENLTVKRARANAYQALQQIRVLQLKKRITPAALPVLRPHPASPSIG